MRILIITTKYRVLTGDDVPHTLINPTDYVMMGTETCCLIADDMDEAWAFSKYMPGEGTEITSHITVT